MIDFFIKTYTNEGDSVLDCSLECGGNNVVDDCGVCSGGNTGHEENSDQDACGVCFGDGAFCLEANIVLLGLVTACLLAGCPTNFSSFSKNATTEGVVL